VHSFSNGFDVFLNGTNFNDQVTKWQSQTFLSGPVSEALCPKAAPVTDGNMPPMWLLLFAAFHLSHVGGERFMPSVSKEPMAGMQSVPY
jgi:hypothetical protein